MESAIRIEEQLVRVSRFVEGLAHIWLGLEHFPSPADAGSPSPLLTYLLSLAGPSKSRARKLRLPVVAASMLALTTLFLLRGR